MFLVEREQKKVDCKGIEGHIQKQVRFLINKKLNLHFLRIRIIIDQFS